ncbi:MAG: SGNH/GDSL hydrolase family protein [Candidatus Pseudobacter hemicellulosilyticus]|uniref:SGNH/GDSL hydrolase family protein n=1 Tax=Candidatus Pseudobacter hemicellulosilyticus TaxID=3121375 RepID=A0AAJ5WRC3_9BACT|nr:MAG: SGNH/GDSL hydrolase family protein [Pseudobacter sp.]
MRTIPILFLLAALSAGVSAQHRLVIIGSSTAGGTGAKPLDSSWARRLDHYYRVEKKLVDTSYILAVGGYPSYKGMPSRYVPPPGRDWPDTAVNISKALRVLDNLPLPANGVVIINYPSNGYDHYSMDEILFTLQTMYDSVTAKGHRCFITTTIPRTDKAFRPSAVKRKMALIRDSILHRFGSSHTLNFYDGFFNPADSSVPDAIAAGDHIHFNNAGHRAVFEKVLAKNVLGPELPVQLPNFQGSLQSKTVQLQWTASLHDPKAGFLLLRSTDNKAFDTIARIPANKNLTASPYSFTDAQPAPGNNRYRLLIRQGSEYIRSRDLTIQNPEPGIQVLHLNWQAAPQQLALSVNAARDYQLTCTILFPSGIAWQQLKRSVKKGDNQLQLPGSLLPAGHYLLQLQYGQEQTLLLPFTK